MVSRKGLLTCTLGDYSELIVAAAFVAEGYEVAFPFGNQHRWDMVVRKPADDKWQTVQVKTIPILGGSKNPTVEIHRQDKNDTAYTSRDISILVAIHPETGTMWKVPPSVFDGCKRCRLVDDLLWKGSVKREATPLVEGDPILVRKRVSSMNMAVKRNFPTLIEQRRHTRESLPATKPEWTSDKSWEAVLRWCNGEGYLPISKDFGVRSSAVRERIIRLLYRLGLHQTKMPN